MTILFGVLSTSNMQCIELNKSIKYSQFSHKYSQNTPHNSPIRSRYGVSFVGPASYRCSVSVSVIIYVISYNNGPRYNSTRLQLNVSRHVWSDTWIITGSGKSLSPVTHQAITWTNDV